MHWKVEVLWQCWCKEWRTAKSKWTRCCKEVKDVEQQGVGCPKWKEPHNLSVSSSCRKVLAHSEYTVMYEPFRAKNEQSMLYVQQSSHPSYVAVIPPLRHLLVRT